MMTNLILESLAVSWASILNEFVAGNHQSPTETEFQQCSHRMHRYKHSDSCIRHSKESTYIKTHTYTHTHLFNGPFFWDYPGEPVKR